MFVKSPPGMPNLVLNCLDENATYEATIYADGKNADYRDTPESIDIVKKTVKKGDLLKIRMAPGGGQAISMVKQ